MKSGQRWAKTSGSRRMHVNGKYEPRWELGEVPASSSPGRVQSSGRYPVSRVRSG